MCTFGQSRTSTRGDTRHSEAHGAQFAILGVGEDIGPRANLGEAAPPMLTTSMRQWLNLQSNRFFRAPNAV